MVKKVLLATAITAISVLAQGMGVHSKVLKLKGFEGDGKFGDNMAIHANAYFVAIGDDGLYWYGFGDDELELYQDGTNSVIKSDSYGKSIATSSKKFESGEIHDYCIVGDPHGGPNRSGIVHLFGSKKFNGLRDSLGKPFAIVPIDGAEGDQFGYGLDILEDRIYIGAPGARNGTGTIYKYNIGFDEASELVANEEFLHEYFRLPASDMSAPDDWDAPIKSKNFGRQLKFLTAFDVYGSVRPKKLDESNVKIERHTAHHGHEAVESEWILQEVYPNSVNILTLPPIVDDWTPVRYPKVYYTNKNTGEIHMIEKKVTTWWKAKNTIVIKQEKMPGFGKSVVTRDSPVIDNYHGKGGYYFNVGNAKTHFETYGEDERYIAENDPLAIFSDNFVDFYVDYCEKGSYELIDTTYHEIDLDNLELNEKRAAVGVEDDKLYTYLSVGDSPWITLFVYDLECPEESSKDQTNTCPETVEQPCKCEEEIESAENGKNQECFVKDVWDYLSGN